jgi:Tol biopolymer transport system component
MAFTWTGPNQDNPDVYVHQIGAGRPLRLTTDPRGDLNPVWSPDGRWIAFLRGQSSGLRLQAGKNEVRLIPPLGGPERLLVEIRPRAIFGNPELLTWCPDGKYLIVTDSQGEGKPDALFVVTLDSGEKRQLTKPQPPTLGDASPAVAPDGRSLVFRRSVSYGIGTGELYWLPLAKDLIAAGEPKRLTTAALNAASPAWIPDSKEILFSARGGLWRQAVAGESPPARLPFFGEDGSMPAVSLPQSGRPARLVYVRSFTDTNIWRVETSAVGAPAWSPPGVSISSTRLDVNPQFSPDGRRVAFGSNRSGNWEVWVSDSDGGNAVQPPRWALRSPAFHAGLLTARRSSFTPILKASGRST